MRFAAGLSWRPGVGKVMLLISCDPVTSGWFYGDAITMLRNGIIRLHYINPLQLKLKTKKKKSIIYGFDKMSVFTVKNLNSQAGDTSLRKQLRIPKDFMSTLATESGGSVFSHESLVQEFTRYKVAASVFGR